MSIAHYLRVRLLRTPIRTVVCKTLAIWLLIIAMESVHGILRQVFLTPWVGDLRARQIGVVFGSGLIFAVAWLCIRWLGVRSTRGLLLLGAAWVALTACFEFALGTALGYSWQRLLADYDPAQGGWMALGMIFLGLAPLLAARLRW